MINKLSFLKKLFALLFIFGIASYAPTNFAYYAQTKHHHHNEHKDNDYSKHHHHDKTTDKTPSVSQAKLNKSTPKDIFMKIVILSTGDIHEHPSHISAISNYIQNERGSKATQKDVVAKHVIAIDAGDFLCSPNGKNCNDHLGGDGAVMAKNMSDIHYNIMTIGNHDFCYGVDQLSKLIQTYTLPIYAANLIHAPYAVPVKTHRLFPYTYTDKDGKQYKLTVGVIGTMSPDPKDYHLGKDSGKKGELKIAAVNSNSVQQWISQYFGKKPDITILVSHQWDNEDKAIHGVNVIIGGHSHNKISDFIGGKMLVKNGFHGDYVGRTTIYWDLKKNKMSGKIKSRLVSM
ncbi:MAG: hypothetical protein A2X78_00670 [Gammaproteobacteria bacterium GWE2_37_16]|nr:MAG: hypothetical protein A2X78_00670 [Gammaproteobacteria bacterium GWE2_37_16]